MTNIVKGYLDYMTWQSRNIHLSQEDLRVRCCQIQQNRKLEKQSIQDPYKCYRKDEKKGFVPLSIDPQRAIWRDSYTLFQTVDESFKRPDVFNWLARVETYKRNGDIQAKSSYSFTALGIATDVRKPGSVLLWRHERLPLPLEYLKNEYLIGKLKDALEMAEERTGAAGVLSRATWNMARRIIAPEADAKKLNKNQKNEMQN